MTETGSCTYNLYSLSGILCSKAFLTVPRYEKKSSFDEYLNVVLNNSENKTDPVKVLENMGVRIWDAGRFSTDL